MPCIGTYSDLIRSYRALIRVKNVWKSYDAVKVLKGLSLDIPSSKTTVILGRSGVGKSVLLRQIAGLETPDEGLIEFDGVNILSLSGKARKRHQANVGMLFQSSALFDSMSIEENVAFSLLHHNASASLEERSIRSFVDEALSKVGLEGYQKKYPSELSGGQKRRAALARLIVYKPQILLFDEPTTGLDPITSSQIAALISDTRKALQGTAIVVTHDIVSALSIGDYFALHHEGHISISGEKDEFLSSSDPALHQFITSALLPDASVHLIQNAQVRGSK
jgi:phospholipid/cholesterol/gamma-HCH transport system ATP-binding protein